MHIIFFTLIRSTLKNYFSSSWYYNISDVAAGAHVSVPGSSLVLISAARITSSSVVNQSDLIFENTALYNWILMILFDYPV